MLFNSFAFVLGFLPITLLVFFTLARRSNRIAALWLVLASLFFYGWWNPRYVPLLLASIAFNFALGTTIARRRESGWASAWLTLGVAANLGMLVWFKYANFLLGPLWGSGAAAPWQDVVLPLGISFFTFTQIAFLVDARRGLAAEYDATRYALFVTWFPHLIAGPILHHRQVMPQFDAPSTYRPDAACIGSGLTLFTIGLAKKVLLADSFGEYAAPVFDGMGGGLEPRFFLAWSAALAFSLQLYFDFSGYSDMAIGLSRMFGVELPLNFNSPYKAASVIEFWRRWHMTLAAFLRDYLYIPLGGNRRGTLRRHANLFVTMLLGGLWHGANATFVAWGAYHGTLLVLNHAWRRMRPMPEAHDGALGHAASVAATFIAVTVGWVLFRSDSLASAARMWSAMAGLEGFSLPVAARAWLGERSWAVYDGVFQSVSAVGSAGATRYLLLLAAGLAIVWLLPNSQEFVARRERLGWPLSRRGAAAFGALLFACLLQLGHETEFLYFQF